MSKVKSKVIATLFGVIISCIIFFVFNNYFERKLKASGPIYENKIIELSANLKSFIVPEDYYTQTNLNKLIMPEVLEYDELEYSNKKPAGSDGKLNYRSIVTTINTQKTVYDVQFNFFKNGRRVTEVLPKIKNEVAILLIGCSFTYGEGAEDYGTFSSMLSKMFPNANVYNLGVPGSGHAQILYEMTHGKEDFYKKFTEKKLIIVNTFFDTHLIRQSCNLSCFGKNQWMLDKPKYVLDRQGHPQFKMFHQDSLIYNPVTKYILGSATFKYLNWNFPDTQSDDNLDLASNIFSEIKNQYEKDHQVLDFYNFFHEWSGPYITEKLAQRLLAKNIKPIIANDEFIKKFPKDYFYITLDSHPNYQGHMLIAESIAWAIKRDYPELAN